MRQKIVGLNNTEKKVIELLIENPSLTSIELSEKICKKGDYRKNV